MDELPSIPKHSLVEELFRISPTEFLSLNGAKHLVCLLRLNCIISYIFALSSSTGLLAFRLQKQLCVQQNSTRTLLTPKSH